MVPNTGGSPESGPPGANLPEWLRVHWRRTALSASSAPRRSNLLIATTSARSNMSIFSNWEGAPYSGVMTYRDTSEISTTAASPCPMPGVSTMMRSNPAARQASMAEGTGEGISDALPRVARERKNTCGVSMAFIRIRSPRSAPPLLRLVGSTANTAMRSLSPWSSRNRRISSSVSEDLPDPPVPVIPSTGTDRFRAARSSPSVISGANEPASIPVITRARSATLPRSSSSRVDGWWEPGRYRTPR